MTEQTPTAVTKFQLPALPYDYTALAPAISEETLRYHHDKHEAAYINKLNELIAGIGFAHNAQTTLTVGNQPHPARTEQTRSGLGEFVLHRRERPER